MKYTAPDGRGFRTYKGKCLCSPCWQARCECGHKLTAHDFDEDGARRGALEAMGQRDPLDRREFAHPPDQCPNASAPHPKARR
jgi:hypothetical protein